MRFPGAYALAFALLAGACGSSSTSVPSPIPSPAPVATPSAPPAPVPEPTPPPAPPNTASVSITPFGLIPLEATVAVGGRVGFVNNDTIAHDIQGGPDPEHRDCPEIDIVGFLTPGQSRQTSPLMTARTCEYHDHAVHQDHGFGGRIVIR